MRPASPILPDRGSGPGGLIASRSDIFPSGRWQLTHAIDATVMGEKKSGLLGVSVLSSADRTLRCALMTIEGFVLFSGRFDGQLTVERALSPLIGPDSPRG